MNGSFSGQVVLVAGGTGGLGRQVSAAFLEEGAVVVVTYRKQTEFDAPSRSAGDRISRLEGHSIDVTDEAAVHQLISTIASKHGRLDALVNAVGGYAAGRALWEMDAKVLDQMLSLNLLSGYVLCRAAVPVMLRHGHGAIVNVALLRPLIMPLLLPPMLRRKLRRWL